jgi:hypothetical protein
MALADARQNAVERWIAIRGIFLRSNPARAEQG